MELEPRPSQGRELLKTLARGFARLAVLPIYASYRVRLVLLGDRAFQGTSQFLSVVPGLVGDYLRREFYRLTLAACAPSVQIVFGTLFASRAARIGENTYVGSCCMIGDAVIGRDVLLGSNVQLLSGKAQHATSDLEKPIRLQPRRFDLIHIGDDTWIGNGSIVMANIGTKCVIGAGSIVTEDIPDHSIAAGNPARVLRMRDGSSSRSRLA
jgi:acetyltransferase-like isoleucine patch superfamily enzyme